MFRSDGVRFLPWQPPAGQQLPENPYALLVTRDGTLWIGTYAGLASWNNGKLTQYPEVGARFITSLLEDRSGTVWAGALGGPPGTPTAVSYTHLDVYKRQVVRHDGRDEHYDIPCAHLVQRHSPHWIYEDENGVLDPSLPFACMSPNDRSMREWESTYGGRILTISVRPRSIGEGDGS